MSRFTFVCGRARADEAGAHDITDAMGTATAFDDRILYCRRCGQAVRMQDALDQTAAEVDLDRHSVTFGPSVQVAADSTGGTVHAR